MDPTAELSQARKRVNARVGFFIHLAVFAVVIVMLTGINFFTSAHYLWFIWPLLGWGTGLFFHALAVFFMSKGSAFRERMMEREIERRKLQQ